MNKTTPPIPPVAAQALREADRLLAIALLSLNEAGIDDLHIILDIAMAQRGLQYTLSLCDPPTCKPPLHDPPPP